MYYPLQKNNSFLFSLVLVLLFSICSCAKQDAVANVTPELTDAPNYSRLTEIDTIITFDPETFEETMEIVESTYYTEVETFPIYGDCSAAGDDPEAIKQCSYQNLMMAIYTNIKYPAIAHDAGVEGTVHVAFRLSPTGNMHYSKVERGSQDKLDEGTEVSEEQAAGYAALDAAALDATRALDGNWTPAMVDGKAVTIQLVLPINFKMTE